MQIFIGPGVSEVAQWSGPKKFGPHLTAVSSCMEAGCSLRPYTPSPHEQQDDDVYFALSESLRGQEVRPEISYWTQHTVTSLNHRDHLQSLPELNCLGC